jgi:hypothetical protein
LEITRQLIDKNIPITGNIIPITELIRFREGWILSLIQIRYPDFSLLSF